MQSKVVGKFCSKQFGCNKWLDLLAVDVLNRFYCSCIWLFVFCIPVKIERSPNTLIILQKIDGFVQLKTVDIDLLLQKVAMQNLQHG